MGFLKFVSDAFGDFLDGLLGGVLDWCADFVTKLFDGLCKVVDAILSIFSFIPTLLGFMDKLLHVVFWMCPPIVFNLLYLAVAIVFIVVIFKKIFNK